jgi:membrane-associated phospholipid phosphatase
VGSALTFTCGFTLEVPLGFLISTTTIMFLVSAFLARRIGLWRVAGWLESTAIAALFGAASILLLAPLLSLSAPYSDPLLARVDAALGFHWPVAARWLLDHPKLAIAEIYAYRSFMWQPLAIFPLLFLTGRQNRGWTVLLAGMLGVLACAVALPFLPAQGPSTFFGVRPAGPFANGEAWRAGEAIDAIKNGYRIIGGAIKGGLVSIPSYHTTAAIIFTWGAWPTRVRWFFLTLNAALICSAVVVGNHYLVDILAGIAVAVVAILSADHILRRGGVDASSDTKDAYLPEPRLPAESFVVSPCSLHRI